MSTPTTPNNLDILGGIPSAGSMIDQPPPPRLSLNWPWIAAVLFLVVLAWIVWGAWNGKFSAQVPLSQEKACPELRILKAQLDLAREDLKKKEDMLFRYENVGAEQAAAVQDHNDTIKDLLDKIGEYSAKMEELIRENETLRKALKEALEDLATCRGKLMQCRAMQAAKRLEHEFCNMTPGSMVLR